MLRYALPQLNKSLISAFIERWHPETSSFHLPFGEMTITLDDVKQITGLAIEGELLGNVEFENVDVAVDLVHRTLGVDKNLIRKEFKENQDQLCLRFTWIKKMMSGKEALRGVDSGNEDTDDEEGETLRKAKELVQCSVRGYLLYSLGCNLFADKSGTRVNVGYLKYLENLDDVCKLAWGASGLAYLYKGMGDASKHNVKQIMGFLALLEVWIYEHFILLYHYTMFAL